MAVPVIRAPDRQPSPNGLTLNLGSNNPFRNRATSPSPNSPHNNSSSPRDNNMQPAAKNPFLDASELSNTPASKTTGNGLTEDIFKDLSLLDKPNGSGAPPPAGKNGPPPPRPDRRPPQSRPTRGPESPGKRDPRSDNKLRPRGMSESSVVDEKERRDRRERHERERLDRPERTESEERRRRERRKEREDRHRREKEKVRAGGGAGRPMKKPQGLDIIDKLDVTGIYGQGLFHHDGPFDACNPHRNAKTARRPAPMQAFPEGSANMALGGSGPLKSRIDLDKFHGRGNEGFSDYAITRKPDTTIMNPLDRVEPVHGDETGGLGTSTFLEGAPASRSALQRRESEDQQTDAGAPGDMSNGGMGGGLTRKKSLVQRFRGMSGSRPRGPGGLRSPEARYRDDAGGDSPPRYVAGKAISAGGPSRAVYSKENEVNPFDVNNNDYDGAFEKKGAEIRFQEMEMGGRGGGSGRRPNSPRAGGLTRSVTADSTAVGRRESSNEEERPAPSSGGGGFLSRMKSLKGGRRARPERRDT